MIILIDLDGTLTNTADEVYKPYKDGKQQFDISKIPIFFGSREFIFEVISMGHQPIIVSDSHPSYVKRIAAEIFGIPSVSLADKPNIDKVMEYLNSMPMLKKTFESKDEFLIIGDSWLDIELGRRLNISTVLAQFYKSSKIEIRDGIGQDWKPIKMGPTYYAKSFEDIKRIIQNRTKELLSVEAIFQGENSDKMVRFLFRRYKNGFTAFRCLGRQNDGECDRFARADKYYQIDNPERSTELLLKLAKSISNYLTRVEKYPQYQWDYLTFVSDKRTTKPPRKMEEIFDLVESKIPKIKIFEWSLDVQGSLRNQPNYKARKEFISHNLKIINGIDLQDKNVIIIDDQFTSSATANEIAEQLRRNGVKNILFVALFYLILPVESKNCPNVINGHVCGKPLKIKINKKTGNKFYSCLPPEFNGNGCGYIENILGT